MSSIAFLQFSSFQSLSRVQLFATPWIAARQASLSITNSRSSLRLTSIESVMVSNHLLLYRLLLLLPSIFPSIQVFFQWVSSSHQLAKAFTEDLLRGISTSPPKRTSLLSLILFIFHYGNSESWCSSWWAHTYARHHWPCSTATYCADHSQRASHHSLGAR